MLFVLLQLGLSLRLGTTFIGNISLANTTIEDPGIFKITMDQAEDLNFSSEVFSAVTIFRNSSTLEIFPYRKYFMYGFQDSTNTSFYFFGFNETNNDTIPLLTNISYQLSEFDIYYDHVQDIHDRVQDVIENVTSFDALDFVSIAFTISDTKPDNKPYHLPYNLTGLMIRDDMMATLSGWQFDTIRFLKEGKLYGLISAIIIVLSYYAWGSVSRITANSTLCQLSLHSFIMHMGFDFSYGLFLFGLIMGYTYFQDLFVLLFLASLMLYFTLQITFITNQWKAAYDIGGLQMDEIRVLFLRFFGELSLLMLASLFAVQVMVEIPIVPLLFLYSPFIPQIVHSCKRGDKKNADNVFTVLITINRLVILWYMFGYEYTIVGEVNKATLIFFSVYLLAQMVIILLQNKYGGAFFIPKKYRRNMYNYFGHEIPAGAECSICMTEIEQGDEMMLTPCNHAYHKECLLRWMQEQMVCPICRAALPIVADEEEEEIRVYN